MKTLLSLSLALGLAVAAASSASAQSQATMNANAAQALQRADSALNSQYTATMARLSPASRTLLRTAQRTWISFRDQQCRFEASGVQGGSAYPMVHSTCLAQLTTERTQQLRNLAQCKEGDLSCPR
ncbi:hypothetical protein SH203_02012 [Brevundimonas sp. SH203]|uniref:lysozyme inhibitor LprI family protein n=1 Tax=Brevundimonas sp. SH203 TaxID=345167 RepID=UPI0009CB9B2A|nr:lysozyme inhibitor LprI family protein [Brevundimonas sp. SH203]GAW41603.1 hypothetical protein SH203_02012 [Brevundimonas sp. SH203]